MPDMFLRFLDPRTLVRRLREYSRKLWVRVLVMGFSSLVALAVAQVVEDFVPRELSQSLNGVAADRLLDVIANAMLAGTIFAITVMVSVYRSSSTQWTPRVHRLIIQDRTTQNTLAVVIGAYVYALVAIILRELGVFDDDSAFVLFVMTVLVLGVIVLYLIRWVLHLQGFGSLINTTRQIEDVTRAEFRDRLANPCLGARALTGEAPKEGEIIRAAESGYIQQIYPEALNSMAKAHGVALYLSRNIGAFVFVNAPLASAVRTGPPEDEDHDLDSLEKAVRANIRLGDVRTFEQDPRFGLLVMGEIGSRALSPGVNDPGTAIDVVTRIGRILSDYTDETGSERENPLDHLHVAPLDPVDLLQDGFGALSRDGAGVVEVQQRLQQTFTALMRHPDRGLRDAARDIAERELRRALDAIAFGPDRARLLASCEVDLREMVTGDASEQA